MTNAFSASLTKLLADLQIDLAASSPDSPLRRLAAAVDPAFRERDLLKAVFDAFPGTISWVSANLDYLGVNAKLAEVSGMPVTAFVGQKVGFVERDGPFAQFTYDFISGKADENHHVIEVKVGAQAKWYAMTAKKYDNRTKVVVIGIDVTELQQIERLIAGLQQQVTAVARLAVLGEVAAGFTHEIGNPLTAVTGAAFELREALAVEPLPRALAEELVDLITAAAAHIGQIVDGSKHLSREEHQARFIQVKALVGEAVALCGKMSKEVGAAVKVEVDPELKLECLPPDILQVLINLLSNACDAVGGLNERWIHVKAAAGRSLGGSSRDAPNDQTVLITVTDSGGGIAEDLRQKIMQPFFTTKAPGKGTGLGLSISRGIVERHGGRLDLDLSSKHTRFVLTLPTTMPKAPS